MKEFLFILIIFFSTPYKGLCQNLVPNSSFEELQGNPGNGHVSVNCSKNWFCSNFSGTDYYVRINGVGEGVPKNDFGIQAPHTGNAYAGLCIHKDYIEYVGAKLSKSLAAGKTYLIEFYISRAEKSATAVKEFGILFSEKPFKSLDKKGFVIEPSVKFTNPGGFKEEKEWVKLSAKYEAEGFETYITLGHFIYDRPEGVKQFSHYYVDDISIIPFDEPQENTDSITNNKQSESVLSTYSPKENETITLENVFFETNKSDLLSESYPELNKLTQFLEKNLDVNITINGHTDNVGSEGKNTLLSQSRAKAVAGYLISKGVSPSRIKYYGFGSLQPIADNETEEGRQKNRRVEFVISKN